MSSLGRNSPCPCGSGRKYKRCCGAADSPLEAARQLHEVDEVLSARILEFGRSELPDALDRAVETCPFDPDDPRSASIACTYLIHFADMGEGTLIKAFLDREGDRLSPRERGWLDACSRSWLSVWEVVDVFPERGLHLRDLLTGEQRGVAERLATQGLRPRLAICARVVEVAGVAVLAGVHPRPFDPLTAGSVVSEVLRGLRAREGPVPVEKLRGESGRMLLDIWEDAADQVDRRPPPRLQNTDGDPLQETLDRFALAAGSRREVEAALGALVGLRIESLPDADGEAATVFRAVRDGSSVPGMDNVSVGSIEIDAAELRVRTNSERRADDLRARIEAACPRLLRHTSRERRGLEDMLASAGGGRVAGAATAPEGGEHDTLILEFKRKYYASWPDEPVPALGGLTPRQAAGSAEERRRLAALLKDLEMCEAREPPGRRFEVEVLRRELGVGDE